MLLIPTSGIEKVNAQVVPDNTLGAESSTVRSIDDLRDRIEGGATRGENLFHSFEQFVIESGLTTEFANLEGIANIFSRVTGGNMSEIFGALRVDGEANLFLMNPNGIIFGENAVVDVGGSFIINTAESIEFNNGEKFSAIRPQQPSLTIDFPVGLNLGSNSGDIQIIGIGNNFATEGISIVEPKSSQIKIPPSKTLAFIAKNIVLMVPSLFLRQLILR